MYCSNTTIPEASWTQFVHEGEEGRASSLYRRPFCFFIHFFYHSSPFVCLEAALIECNHYKCSREQSNSRLSRCLCGAFGGDTFPATTIPAFLLPFTSFFILVLFALNASPFIFFAISVFNSPSFRSLFYSTLLFPPLAFPFAYKHARQALASFIRSFIRLTLLCDAEIRVFWVARTFLYTAPGLYATAIHCTAATMPGKTSLNVLFISLISTHPLLWLRYFLKYLISISNTFNYIF